MKRTPPLVRMLGLALALSVQAACSEPASKGTNLVLITIDTVRADRIGAYGHAGASTPVIDGIAARGVRFDDAISQASTTPPSHASILTGLYPARHGLRRLHGQRLPTSNQTLAELLQEEGYATAAFVSALPLRKEMGLDQGFDLYDDDLGIGPRGKVQQTVALQTNARVSRWLDEGTEQPVFLWVHYFDAHFPYAPPPEFSSRFGVGERAAKIRSAPRNINASKAGRKPKAPPAPVVDRMSRLYDAEIAYLDAAIGDLLERLENEGILRDAVVAVVADHGEHLGEGGYFFGHWDVLDETARVPMLLAHSDGRHAGRVVERSVGTIDLLPTLLAWLGHPRDLAIDGLDLSVELEGGQLPDRPIYSEQFEYFPVRAVRAGPWMLRQVSAPNRPISEGSVRLTRRGDTQQPEDADEAAIQRSFEEALAAAALETVPSEVLGVSEEVRTQLEALGYADEAGGPDVTK